MTTSWMASSRRLTGVNLATNKNFIHALITPAILTTI